MDDFESKVMEAAKAQALHITFTFGNVHKRDDAVLNFSRAIREFVVEECAKVCEDMTEIERAKIRHLCDDGAPCKIAAAIRALTKGEER
jgi:FAD synthase